LGARIFNVNNKRIVDLLEVFTLNISKFNDMCVCFGGYDPADGDYKEYTTKIEIQDGILVIPETVRRFDFIQWLHLYDHDNCTCRLARLNVKKIVIEANGIEAFGVFSDFENLEVVHFKHDIDFFIDDLRNCRKLKRIIIDKDCSNSFFRYVVQLRDAIRELDIRFDLPHYTVGLFKDCANLDPKWVLREGLKAINSETFRNCDSFVDISLPKSLRSLHVEAFRDCKNIKTFKINSYVVFEGPYEYINQRISNKNLLRQSKEAVVYCPKDFPINYLRKNLWPEIPIIEANKIYPSSRDDTISNKFKVLGLSKIIRDIPETKEELICALSAMDTDRWKQMIVSEIIDVIETDWTYNMRIIGDGVFFVKVNIGSSFAFRPSNCDARKVKRNMIKPCLSVDIEGNYCILNYLNKRGNIYKFKFLMNKEAILEKLKGETSNKAYVTTQPYNGYEETILNLPVELEEVDGKGIDNRV
jgi:hypothetical protein